MNTTELKPRIAEHRDNPHLFVKQVIRPPTISADQKSFLDAVGIPGSRVSASTGTCVGITAACAWLVLWFISSRGAGKCGCTSTTTNQTAHLLWPEIEKWKSFMDPDYSRNIVVEPDRIYLRDFKHDCFAFPVRSGKDSYEGFMGICSKEILFLFCDPGGIPQIVFDVAAGTVIGKNDRWACAGSPFLAKGPFYDTHHSKSSDWNTMRFSSLDSPFCDPSFPRRIADTYGKRSDVYRVRVLGKFPLNSAAHRQADNPANPVNPV